MSTLKTVFPRADRSFSRRMRRRSSDVTRSYASYGAGGIEAFPDSNMTWGPDAASLQGESRLAHPRGTSSLRTSVTGPSTQQSSITIVWPYLRSPQRICCACADTLSTGKACCQFPILCAQALENAGGLLPVLWTDCETRRYRVPYPLLHAQSDMLVARAEGPEASSEQHL
jgi:hypothetical protein